MKYQRIATLFLCSVAVGMLALSQPAQPQSEREHPEPRADKPEGEPPYGRVGLELKIDPDALRVRLQRSIARNEELLERNRAALEKLNAGAPASDILNELRPSPGERGLRAEARNERGPVRTGEQAGEMQDRDAILKFLQAEFPQLWHNIKPIEEDNPRNADRLLRTMAPQIQEILYLQKSHPVLATLKTEQMHVGLDFVEASRAYGVLLNNRESTEADRAEAHELLMSLATSRFDVELKSKQYEINRLESRLTELKASITQVESRRDQEIADMVEAAKRNAERQYRQRRRNNPSDDQAGSGDD